MAQDPDDQQAEGDVDTSHDLDMVTLFSSSNIDSEMEATAIQTLLRSNGIPSVIVGASTIPVLEFQVQVPRALVEDAERMVQEAQAAGPEAAAEAEAASEE